jgi:hypothetical protein
VPRARSVTEGRQLKYVLRIKTKTKGRRRVSTFIESWHIQKQRQRYLYRENQRSFIGGKIIKELFKPINQTELELLLITNLYEKFRMRKQ